MKAPQFLCNEEKLTVKKCKTENHSEFESYSISSQYWTTIYKPALCSDRTKFTSFYKDNASFY